MKTHTITMDEANRTMSTDNVTNNNSLSEAVTLHNQYAEGIELESDEHGTADITISKTTLSVIYIVIGILGLLGNIIVIVIFSRMKMAKKGITYVFIINQSVIDLTTATFLILTTVIQREESYLDGVLDDLYCRIWLGKVPIWCCIMTSSYNLVFLTIERYLEVIHPIWHKVNFTNFKAGVFMALPWIIGPAFNIVYDIPTSKILYGKCLLLSFWPSHTAQKVAGFAAVILQYFIPIACLAYCYSAMAYVIHQKTKGIQPAPSQGQPTQQSQTGSTTREYKMTRAKKNIIKTLAIVSLAFTLCYSSNQWFFLLFNLEVLNYSHFQSIFYHFSVVAMFFNCSVNPVIYVIKHKHFRQYLMTCICFWNRANQQGYSINTGASVS